jgi:hypothetical protein
VKTSDVQQDAVVQHSVDREGCVVNFMSLFYFCTMYVRSTNIFGPKFCNACQNKTPESTNFHPYIFKTQAY